MESETLSKVLCHSVSCGIQSQGELGIEPVFWQNEAAGHQSEPVVLSL